jgi:hypothetical protein
MIRIMWVKRVNLTEAQRKDVLALSQTYDRQLRTIQQTVGTNWEDAQTQYAALRKRALGRVNDILTPSQRQASVQSTGQSFDFPPPFARQPKR